MADVMTLFARLVLDTKGYDTGLEKAKQDASSAGQGIAKGLSGVGKAVVGVGKACAVGVGAGAAAIGVLTKQSVSSYAQYEQLTGGVKKLFGNAADDVMKFANEAYKTSGMSANQYMEQATSFSAALINSLGGDTKKAAEQADVAMRAMSDNVNTFGTDMGSVQNAFQGFAKGNYTMLDNLKLGYGGTAEEMQRLIDDANKIGEANGEAADLSINSFSDIVTAIQRIQEEQHIAGTTSKEAATTIEGSFGMTKAAWENLVAGFANPDADLDKLMDNLIVAVVGDKEGEGLLNNLIPVIERALEGIGQFLVKAAPVISERLPALMEAILPSLLSAATSLVAGLVRALPTILQILIDQAPMIMSTIAQALLDVAPLLLDMVAQIFVLLVDAAGTGIELLWNAAMELIAPMIEAINNAFAAIGDFLADLWESIKTTLGNAWTAIGNAVTSAWNAITTTISNILNGIKTTVSSIWDGIKTTISNVLNAIKTTVSNVWNNIKTTISDVINGIKTTVTNVWNSIKTTVSNVINGIKDTVTDVWNNIKTSITDTVENIRSGIAEKFQAVYDKAKEIFENVKSAITNPVESAKEFVGNLIEDIKGFFDFDWSLPELKLPHIIVGNYIDVPVLGTIPDPTSLRVEWYRKAYENPWMFTRPTVMGFGDGVGGEMVYGHDNLMRDIRDAVGSQPRTFAPIINVYTQEGQSNEDIAHKVMDILTFEYQRQGSVFA